jgi:hypothetical protein
VGFLCPELGNSKKEPDYGGYFVDKFFSDGPSSLDALKKEIGGNAIRVSNTCCLFLSQKQEQNKETKCVQDVQVRFWCGENGNKV